MTLRRHILIGTLFCLLGPTRIHAARYHGPGDGGNVSEEDQLSAPSMEDKVSSGSPRGITRSMVFPFYRSWEDRSEESSINSVADDAAGKQTKHQRRRLGLEEKVASSYPRYTAGANSQIAIPQWPDIDTAGLAHVFTSPPASSQDEADNHFNREGTLPLDTEIRPPLYPHLSPSYSGDEHVILKDLPLEKIEQLLFDLISKSQLLARLQSEEAYRLLAVKLFELRARSFRETVGIFPGDKVFEHFFLSAERGTLEDELSNYAKLRLFVYCIHLEARDMAEGYLFSRRLGAGTADFVGTLQLFRQAVKDKILLDWVDDDAERYLLYRFYLALQRKTLADGNQEDLPLVDKHMLSLVSAGILQHELEIPESRRYIIDKILTRPNVLNRVPIPPPRPPPPPPPPTESPTAGPTEPFPEPKPPAPKPDKCEPPKKSSSVKLDFSLCTLSLLAIGAVVSSA